MKNKKGFTLIELTAVIALIALIALLASIPINKMVKDSKDELYNKQLNQIILMAQNWASDNNELLPTSTDSVYKITIKDLYDKGYLEDYPKDPRVNKEIPNCSYVEITLNSESINEKTLSYKYRLIIQETCADN